MIDHLRSADTSSNDMGERNFIDLDGSPSSAPLDPGDSSAGGVRDFCSMLERAVKTVCLYPPTNPLPDEFRGKLFDTLTRQLESSGRFVLVTTDSSFLYEDQRVYERLGTEENLAYLLFRDGVREIAFEPGVERAECDRFLAALVGAFSVASMSHDIANRLWEVGLPHIRHYTVDRVVSGTYIDMADDDRLASRHEQFLRTGASGASVTAGLPPCPDQPESPYEGAQQERFRYVMQVFGQVDQLSAGDQARIAGLANGESPQTAEQLGLDILFEIAGGSQSPILVGEAMTVMEKQYDRFVQTDAWNLACVILQGWRTSLPNSTENSTRHLQQALSYAAEPRHFERLTKYLNSNPDTDLGNIRTFLDLFDVAALKPVTAMLCHLEHRPARKMVCTFLSARGAEGIDLIGGFVYDKRWYVVRNVAMVLGEIGHERAVGYLRKSAGHTDQRVRQETLRALKRIGGLEAARVLLTFLDDSESSLRRQALRGIGSEDSAACLVELKRRAEDSNLVDQDPDETRELLKAYARVGGPAATRRLLHLANRSVMFARRWLPVKLAAIEALGSCRTSEARVHLELLAQNRNKEIAQTARAAMKHRLHAGSRQVGADDRIDEDATE